MGDLLFDEKDLFKDDGKELPSLMIPRRAQGVVAGVELKGIGHGIKNIQALDRAILNAEEADKQLLIDSRNILLNILKAALDESVRKLQHSYYKDYAKERMVRHGKR